MIVLLRQFKQQYIMNKFKKGILGFIKGLGSKKSKKRERFDNKVLNLTLQKIDGDGYKFNGNAVYSADMSVLVYVFNTDEEFKVPDGVEIIGMMAFRNKRLMKNVVIPPSVKVIEKNAFRGCDSLDRVLIPAGVESVKANAFTACDSLQTVTFGGTVKELNRHAFDNSDNLHLIVVPEGKVRTYHKALRLRNDNKNMMVVEGEKREEKKTDRAKKAEKKPATGRTRKTPVRKKTEATKGKEVKPTQTKPETMEKGE